MGVERHLFRAIETVVAMKLRSAFDGKNRKYKDQNRRLSELKGGKTDSVKA